MRTVAALTLLPLLAQLGFVEARHAGSFERRSRHRQVARDTPAVDAINDVNRAFSSGFVTDGQAQPSGQYGELIVNHAGEEPAKSRASEAGHWAAYETSSWIPDPTATVQPIGLNLAAAPPSVVIETVYATTTVWVDGVPSSTAVGDAATDMSDLPAESLTTTLPIEVAALAAEASVISTSDVVPTSQLSQVSNPIDAFLSSSLSEDLVPSPPSLSTTSLDAAATVGLSVNASVSGGWYGGGGGAGGSKSSKLVFAHFMVGIVHGYTLQDWTNDIRLAKSYGIDGWALNIGLDWYSQPQLDLAYQAASAEGDFVCFISFDFNWYTLDNTTGVSNMMKRFKDQPAQLRVDGKPFVSTFIGDGFDWTKVAEEVGEPLFAVPFWQPTQEVADNKGLSGLFSWAAWPGQLDNQPVDAPMTTNRDMEYLNVLGKASKKYMAPVSSWFFTHFGKEVAWSKNWLFKSESLWKDRWDQVLEMGDKLDFIEIVTWNDYGESHNVANWGGNHSDDGSSKWSIGLDHLPMLDLSLPYIKAWKSGKSKPVIQKDQMIYWYRPHLKSAECDGTDNFGSKPTGWEYVNDTVFITTLTKFGGTVKITSGSNSPVIKLVKPGVELIEVPMGVGNQTFEFFTLTGGYHRSISSVPISDKCWEAEGFPGIYNYNYHAGLVNCE